MNLRVLTAAFTLLAFRAQPQHQSLDMHVPLDKVLALVAHEDLPMGMMLRSPEKHFRYALIDRSESDQDLLIDFADIKGKSLSRTLLVNDVLHADDLARAVLPEGVRLIQVRVDSADPQLKSGAFADVFWTLTENGTTTSRMMLQNVIILESMCGLPVDPNEDLALARRKIGLGLRPEDFSKLAPALERGRIDVVLRLGPERVFRKRALHKAPLGR